MRDWSRPFHHTENPPYHWDIVLHTLTRSILKAVCDHASMGGLVVLLISSSLDGRKCIDDDVSRPCNEMLIGAPIQVIWLTDMLPLPPRKNNPYAIAMAVKICPSIPYDIQIHRHVAQAHQYEGDSIVGARIC